MSEKCICGKCIYPTWTRANQELKAINRKKRKLGTLMPYNCKLCGKFHLGHTNKFKRVK